MLRLFLAGLAILCACLTANAQESGLQPILQEHQEIIAKSSRKTIKPAIDAITASGLPQAQVMLETWAAKDMWMRKSDGFFFAGKKVEGRSYELTDFDTGEVTSTTLLVPLGDRADAIQRLEAAGLLVNLEDGLAKIEEPFPQTPFFEKIGTLFDYYADEPVQVATIKAATRRSKPPPTATKSPPCS